jgi:predicted RNA-binding protein YlqC (UPF0109 family)
VVVNLIEQPQHAQIKIAETAPNVLRIKLVMVQRDVSMLVGTGGHTAAALRNILQTVASQKGVQALLRIRSHEDDA